MSVAGNVRFELEGRFASAEVGKTHISVRYEPGARIARVGIMLGNYTWDNRMKAIETLMEFEGDHRDELAVDFDILPLDSVTDETFATA